MKAKWMKVATLIAMGLLLGTASVAVPADVSAEFLTGLQQVVEPIIQQLDLGDFSPYYLLLHTEEYVEIRTSETQVPIRVYSNPQRMKATKALRAYEKGYAVARAEAEGPFRLSGIDYEPGEYFLVLWITDQGFERFGIEFPRRTPLLIFLASSSPLELVDFAIPKGVEILQDLTADQGVMIEVLQAAETMGFAVDTGVFRLTFDDATPQPIPVTLTIPLADQIFIEVEEEPEEPPEVEVS